MELIETHPGAADFYLFNEAEKNLAPEKFMANPVASRFLKSCHVLMYNDKPSGRFALYDNPSLLFENRKAICIGNYECVEGADCSAFMLKEAESIAQKMGASWLIGPMNGSTWENYRFADYNSENDFFPEPENPAYYTTQFTNSSFEKIASYFSAYDEEMHYDFPKIKRREKEFLDAGYIFRPINLAKYSEELEKILTLSLDAFSGNFLFTPIEKDAFIQKYIPLLPLIDPAFVLMAEDPKGDLAGFVFCLDDIRDKSRKRLVLKSLARRPGRQDRGLGDVLGTIITERAAKAGYDGVVHVLMSMQGSSVNLSKKRTLSVIKTHSLYAKRLR